MLFLYEPIESNDFNSLHLKSYLEFLRVKSSNSSDNTLQYKIKLSNKYGPPYSLKFFLIDFIIIYYSFFFLINFDKFNSKFLQTPCLIIIVLIKKSKKIVHSKETVKKFLSKPDLKMVPQKITKV